MRIPKYSISVAALAIAALAGGATARAEAWLEDPVTGCKIWTDRIDGVREAVTWSGACDDGKASGIGVLVWVKDGSIVGRYEGGMQGGRLHGQGLLHYRPADRIEDLKADVSDRTLDDGRIVYQYEGTVRDGEVDGRGALRYESSRGFDRYEADFENGEINGRVMYRGANGDTFEGATKGINGIGEGLYVGASGERYEGPFENGQPAGRGTYTAPNGDVFEANFVNGKADGPVTITRADGTREELVWKNGVQQ